MFLSRAKRYAFLTYICNVRAFPTHFASILYFTSSKSHFSILTTHFYKTPHIPFSILQYIILKYYKIILFLYIFFHSPTKPTATIKTLGADQSQPQQPNQQPRSTTQHQETTQAKLATTGATTHSNHPKPTHASSTTATTCNPHTYVGKPKPQPPYPRWQTQKNFPFCYSNVYI